MFYFYFKCPQLQDSTVPFTLRVPHVRYTWSPIEENMMIVMTIIIFVFSLTISSKMSWHFRCTMTVSLQRTCIVRTSSLCLLYDKSERCACRHNHMWSKANVCVCAHVPVSLTLSYASRGTCTPALKLPRPCLRFQKKWGKKTKTLSCLNACAARRFSEIPQLMLTLSEALLLFNEEVKTPHNKGEYRNPN
jgi:hypothetical protein